MKQNKPIATKIQNTLFAIILGWPVIAVYADGWHHHQIHHGPESLFNPFHLFIYLGVFCAGLFIALIGYANYRRGHSLKNCLPAMYVPAAWGIALFSVAASCDLLWHSFFGFEESVDALLSPPHMILAAGGLLAVSCLLWPIWRKEPDKTISTVVPVLGFIYFFIVFDFFIQYCHPYYQRWLSDGVPVVGGVSYIQAAALAGGFLRTIIFCGMLFSTLRYFKFPKGSLFAILVVEAIALGFMGGQFQYVVGAIFAGIITEAIYHKTYDRLGESAHLRIFGFLMPIAFFVPYIITSLALNETWWSIHMVAGVIAANAIIGLMLTYLIEPPQPYED